MESELSSVELNRDGVIESYTQREIEEPFIADEFRVRLNGLDEYAVPTNLVKITRFLLLDFDYHLGMNEDILNFIFELEKKCEDGVELFFSYTTAFTQADWDFLIENVVNNPRLKFWEYCFSVRNENDITFNFNTDRNLYISKQSKGILTLKGKMGKVKYTPSLDYLKVEGTFSEFLDLFDNPIQPHELYDYENLPDLYESLNERLRRLTTP